MVDGRFTSAACTCGWRSAGRRSRAMVRAEARDHALLYVDGRLLVIEPDAPAQSEAQAESEPTD